MKICPEPRDCLSRKVEVCQGALGLMSTEAELHPVDMKELVCVPYQAPVSKTEPTTLDQENHLAWGPSSASVTCAGGSSAQVEPGRV